MINALAKTNFNFKGQTGKYNGKVRDVYFFGDKVLAMIVTDRISAFDVILPRAIPYKGEVLNKIASYFLNATKDIVPNWILDIPDAQAAVGLQCKTLRVEMVIRGYLSGHAWRTYKDGKRELCGVMMQDGLKESDKFIKPLITPTTKSNHGHDEDISREEIIKRNIVDEKTYLQLEDYTHKLYERGCEMAAKQNLILVDTKYEFGIFDNTIYLIDEIHTPDSSRYFYANGYEERQKTGEPQKQLSKEFLRQWLIQNNFQGFEGQQVPEMTDEVVQMVSDRYIELYENITGLPFKKNSCENIEERIFKNVSSSVVKFI